MFKRIPRIITVKKSAIAFALMLVLSIAMCFLHGSTGAYQVYYNRSFRRVPIYSVEREDKKISISFDCAWGAEKTDALLECMDEYGVKCTFFMTEFWVEKYPEMVKKIFDKGHDVGTHSATHSYMSKMNEYEIEKELESSSQAIESITGERVVLFRPPYGDYDDKLIETCEKRGLFAIQWDVDSLDWKDVTANQIAKRIIERTKEGSIILCHNNAENTLEALPHVFANLMGRGYEFVKISELIYRENFTVDSQGRQRRNVQN